MEPLGPAAVYSAVGDKAPVFLIGVDGNRQAGSAAIDMIQDYNANLAAGKSYIALVLVSGNELDGAFAGCNAIWRAAHPATGMGVPLGRLVAVKKEKASFSVMDYVAWRSYADARVRQWFARTDERIAESRIPQGMVADIRKMRDKIGLWLSEQLSDYSHSSADRNTDDESALAVSVADFAFRIAVAAEPVLAFVPRAHFEAVIDALESFNYLPAQEAPLESEIKGDVLGVTM